MAFDDLLVAAISVVLAVAAWVAAWGRWQAPFHLRSVSAIDQRYGRGAARTFLFLIGLALMILAITIAFDWRPIYASLVGWTAAAR